MGLKAARKMVEVRLTAFRAFQESNKSVALLSINDRFIAAAEMIFFQNSFFYKHIRVPIELIVFAIGVYFIFRRRDLFLITIFTFLVLIPVLILPYNIPRYFYWILPFVYIIAGVCFNPFKEVLDKKGYTLLKSKWILKLQSFTQRVLKL
jgi:hypothetical protein